MLASMGGCYYDNLAEQYPDLVECDTISTVSFANDIAPIMSGSCSSANASCHGPGNFNNALLNEYSGVKEQADNGKLISAVTWDGVATPSRMPSVAAPKLKTA